MKFIFLRFSYQSYYQNKPFNQKKKITSNFFLPKTKFSLFLKSAIYRVDLYWKKNMLSIKSYQFFREKNIPIFFPSNGKFAETGARTFRSRS